MRMFTNQAIKLQDSYVHGLQSGAELLIVEGDSAAAAVANCRNKQLQAVLPMQGKPMNVRKASLQKVQNNPLFNALQASISADFVADSSENSAAQFNLANCRYQRIILLMDADADGIHCGALMLIYFYTYMRPLLENGMLAIVRAPVGEVTNLHTNNSQYAQTDAEFFALCMQAKNLPTPAQYLQIQKYRGLAGIPTNVLSHFCINPATRKIEVLGIKDAQMALEIFGA